MGRMPELDFIEFIQSKPLTPKDVADIQEFIRRDREARAKTRAARETGSQSTGIAESGANAVGLSTSQQPRGRRDRRIAAPMGVSGQSGIRATALFTSADKGRQKANASNQICKSMTRHRDSLD